MEGGLGMNMTIRRAMISDAKPIYELCHNELGYQYSEDQVTANVRRLIGDSTNLVLVAEQNGEVVGFIHAHNHDPIYAPPMKNVVAMAVRHDHQMHGLGRTLIGAVENWALEDGACAVRLSSGEHMDEALHFYKSMGYEYIKTQYNFRKTLR